MPLVTLQCYLAPSDVWLQRLLWWAASDPDAFSAGLTQVISSFFVSLSTCCTRGRAGHTAEAGAGGNRCLMSARWRLRAAMTLLGTLLTVVGPPTVGPVEQPLWRWRNIGWRDAGCEETHTASSTNHSCAGPQFSHQSKGGWKYPLSSCLWEWCYH